MGQQVYKHWLKTVTNKSGKTAFRDTGNQVNLSFEAIHSRTEHYISILSLNGSLKNRVVAIQLPNSADWLAAFLACQAIDAIAMPIDPDVPASAAEKVSSQLNASAQLDNNGFTLLEQGTTKQPACLIKLTSGTTGKPRPLFFSDSQMLADGSNVMRTMGITGSDSNLATIPFGHSYGLGNLVMPFIMSGCEVHVCHDPFPHTIASIVSMNKTTVYPTVPAILKAIIRADIDPESFKSLRLWISAGSQLNAGVATRFKEVFRKSVHNFYGSSETGGIAYDRTGKDTLTGRSVGTPLDGVKLALSQSNRLVVESAAVYTRHNRRSGMGVGQYMLPDVAGILNDGSVRLTGRKDRIVKLAGKRLSLGEIEKSLVDLESIEACYVDAYRDSSGRTRVGCVVASSLSEEAMKRHLLGSLAKWKVPTRWIVVESMPVNARGKIDRTSLRKIIARGIKQE